MSSLVLVALKVGFLVLMWLFIGFVVNTIRVDLFGRRVSTEELVASEERPSSLRGTRARNGEPTRIVVTTGRGAGASAPLPTGDEEILLGRAAGADLDVDDDYASSRHARIWRDEQGWVVEDLQSTNGTYVNGQRIAQATRIQIGDVVRVGRSQMQLEV